MAPGSAGVMRPHRKVKIGALIAEKTALAGLEFLIIGGNAVIAPRMTADVDCSCAKRTAESGMNRSPRSVTARITFSASFTWIIRSARIALARI